jgi:hypothetical protein
MLTLLLLQKTLLLLQLQNPPQRLRALLVQKKLRRDANHNHAAVHDTSPNEIQAACFTHAAANAGERQLLNVSLQATHKLTAAIAPGSNDKHPAPRLRKQIAKAQLERRMNDSATMLTYGVHQAVGYSALVFELNPSLGVGV